MAAASTPSIWRAPRPVEPLLRDRGELLSPLFPVTDDRRRVRRPRPCPPTLHEASDLGRQGGTEPPAAGARAEDDAGTRTAGGRRRSVDSSARCRSSGTTTSPVPAADAASPSSTVSKAGVRAAAASIVADPGSAVRVGGGVTPIVVSAARSGPQLAELGVATDQRTGRHAGQCRPSVPARHRFGAAQSPCVPVVRAPCRSPGRVKSVAGVSWRPAEMCPACRPHLRVRAALSAGR